MNILVVEDEPDMASTLIRGLREELLEVQLAQNGKRALQLSEDGSFDLILLDVMLPDVSGFDVLQKLRERNQKTPVLMLTARDALSDIVRGLDSGADDYLTKPFSFSELLARIRALGRRGAIAPKNTLEVHDLVLDIPLQRTFRKGRPRASGASGQKLHYARRIAAAERRACVPTESRAARGGGGRSVGC